MIALVLAPDNQTAARISAVEIEEIKELAPCADFTEEFGGSHQSQEFQPSNGMWITYVVAVNINRVATTPGHQWGTEGAHVFIHDLAVQDEEDNEVELTHTQRNEIEEYLKQNIEY